jgi:hypothetical protein
MDKRNAVTRKIRDHTDGKVETGRTDRYPSDYGVRDRDDDPPEDTNKTSEHKGWVPGDKGQGREGHSKGCGGSGGDGTGPSGPERK